MQQAQTAQQNCVMSPWRAAGVQAGAGLEWYYCFEINGRILRVRSALMTTPASMLTIDPDANRWRAMFPHPHSRTKFDHMQAAGFLMKECWAAQVRLDEQAKLAASKLELAQTGDAGTGLAAPVSDKMGAKLLTG